MVRRAGLWLPDRKDRRFRSAPCCAPGRQRYRVRRHAARRITSTRTASATCGTSEGAHRRAMSWVEITRWPPASTGDDGIAAARLKPALPRPWWRKKHLHRRLDTRQQISRQAEMKLTLRASFDQGAGGSRTAGAPRRARWHRGPDPFHDNRAPAWRARRLRVPHRRAAACDRRNSR